MKNNQKPTFDVPKGRPVAWDAATGQECGREAEAVAELEAIGRRLAAKGKSKRRE